MKAKVEATVTYTTVRKFVVECDVDLTPDEIENINHQHHSSKGWKAIDDIYDQIDADDLDFNAGKEVKGLQAEIDEIKIVGYKEG